MQAGFDERERESVIRDLVSPDEDVRRLAVERVAVLPLEEALPLLVGRLGDSSWRVRKAAVERFVDSPETEQVASALVAALGDGENPGRRNSAVEALVHCGSRVVPALLEAASSDDADVRKFVVDALAGIADPRASDRLLALLRDADANVRAAVADALGVLGGEGVAPALLDIAVCREEDPTVRFSALRALSALEAEFDARALAPVLDDPILRAGGLELLGRCDDEQAAAVLLKGLGSGSRSSREAAMRALLRTLSRADGARAEQLAEQMREVFHASPALAEGAIERLEEADLATRLVIVQFLGLTGSERAVIPILRAGRDEALSQVCLATLAQMGEVAEAEIDGCWSRLEVSARRDACSLFGSSGGERGAARLLSALEDAELELRIAAARSIGERRLAGALTALVRRIESVASDEDYESEEEMLALVDALIRVAEPRAGGEAVTQQAIELLRLHLDGAGDAVRLAIAKVLGCIGRRQDTQLVTFLLKDPSALVRRAAVDALARLEPGTAAEPLRLALADETATVRIAAASALGASQSDDVIDDLKRLADDEDPRVRASAVRSLGRRFGRAEDPQRRSAALAVIEAALRDDALVVLGAIEALDSIGGPEAARVSAVLERPEPELVKEAVACLSRHGETAALEALVPMVSHGDWSVRAEAIQALAERGVQRAVPPILRRLETEQDEFVRDAILRALKRLEG